MARSFTLLALATVFAVLALFGPLAGAQAGGAADTDADVRARRLEAWAKLDAAEQARLQERFEAFQRLSEQERVRLRERAERLAREMDATLASLDPEERAEVEQMQPKERARVLRALVADRAREAAARLRERLTDDERERLVSAEPAERRRILHSVRQRERKRLPEHLAGLTRAMGLSPAEVRMIERGSRSEKRAAIAAFVRRRSGAYVGEHGLPDGLGADTWSNVLQRDDEAFLRSMLRIRARHPEFGIPKERWEKRLRHRRSLQRRLVGLSTPTTRDRMRRPPTDGPRADRADRGAILRNRARAEELLARHPSIDAASAEGLRSLDDDGFVRAFRFLLRQIEAGAEPGRGLQRWFDRGGDARR